jgi:hypothetical protein
MSWDVAPCRLVRCHRRLWVTAASSPSLRTPRVPNDPHGEGTTGVSKRRLTVSHSTGLKHPRRFGCSAALLSNPRILPDSPSTVVVLVVGAYQHCSHEGLLYSNPPMEFRHSSPEALHTKRRERPLLAKDGAKARKFS